MDMAVEKLELVQLLINTNSEVALKKIKAILNKYSIQSETEYLLSTKANRKYFMKGIEDLKNGKSVVIKTSDLWK